ncbi:MAG TPA: metalloregulator ArsR/SmtB family transcription factor [Thermoanaerobaculia bacterium]|nr:metalloregulator ArsR/SmtB family transcription factor [Thermoanaerobaculia bacterium]
MNVISPRKKRHAKLSPEAVALVAGRFRVLGEPLRVRILEELRDGEKNVTELVVATGSTQSNVSKHLRTLQEAGLIGRRQSGNQVFCYIDDPSVFDLCDTVCASVGDRLVRQTRVATELNRRG